MQQASQQIRLEENHVAQSHLDIDLHNIAKDARSLTAHDGNAETTKRFTEASIKGHRANLEKIGFPTTEVFDSSREVVSKVHQVEGSFNLIASTHNDPTAQDALRTALHATETFCGTTQSEPGR